MTKQFLQMHDFKPGQLQVSRPDQQLFHIFNEEDCLALWSAYAAGRPLLVRGKPGTGKSQMARAIAAQLNWAFVSEVIRGSTELSDLHWHFDAIGRLGEAQAMNNHAYAAQKTVGGLLPLDPLNFLSPGAFWWAYDWCSAEQQYGRCCTRLRPQPHKPNSEQAVPGVVLLLDEIDKAEPDLPNGLLETLGNYQFMVPYLEQQSAQGNGLKNPVRANAAQLLVVITTNEERELPPAFVRRCFVHTLKMETSMEIDKKGVEKRYQWLITRGELHFGNDIAEGVYLQAAKLLWRDRVQSMQTPYLPGLAEYIDLLTALRKLPHTEQKECLDKIAAYALNKALADE